MRIVVFQGQSNYDVLRDLSRFTADGFRQWGHDVFLCDMNWVDGLDYIRAVHEFKPDFTLGYNPICYWFNGRTHFEATGIPHFIQLGDSPFYHVTERALTEPDHPLVYTLLNETSFLQQMKEIGVKNFRRVKTYQAVSAFKESNHNYRSFPIVFFGSLFPYEAEIKNIQSIFDGQLRDILLEFLSFLPEWMNHNGVFLPVPIDQFFNNCVDMKLEDQYRFDFMKMIYPFIDRYYRYYTRSFVLEQFAKSGLPLMVFGDEHTKTLLSEYPNVKVFSPVPFRECLEIYAQSKIVLNISPSFFYAHERICHRRNIIDPGAPKRK